MLSFINKKFGSYRGLIRLILANLKYYMKALHKYKNHDWSTVNRLVFVCQGNICRSPYAHFVALKYTDSVASYGYATTSNKPANDTAILVASERGVDLSGHKTTNQSDFEFGEGDLLILMEERHVSKIKFYADTHGSQIALLGLWAKPVSPLIYDPYSLSKDYFHSCYDSIDSAVANIVNDFKGRKSTK